ncbi:hypothetical protein NPIL_660161 [Nephila pilipes]|uniref:Uncharacterized protein n=1 Tax=Nephila pilipes TaxID=299642 RepID=A0A8X6KGI6_NEPPI|nr:hypothetical protein NPIL_660161 [Nephila pilipes]
MVCKRLATPGVDECSISTVIQHPFNRIANSNGRSVRSSLVTHPLHFNNFLALQRIMEWSSGGIRKREDDSESIALSRTGCLPRQ